MPTPAAFDAPVKRKVPSEYCHDLWYGNTRIVWVSHFEKLLKICTLFVLTEFTNVKDGRTDGHRMTA